MCNSSTINTNVFQAVHFINSCSLVSLQKPQKKERKKKQLSGNEEAGGEGLVWGEDYLAVSKFPYEQGGSSDGVRGPQEGTVLRDRKAKMEGS